MICKFFLDPRLAFAQCEKNINISKMNFSKNFNENSTALDVVKSRDLTGWSAIVTGANRGIGKHFIKCYFPALIF